MMPAEVEARFSAVKSVTSVNIEFVWDLPWDQPRLSDPAQLELGFV